MGALEIRVSVFLFKSFEYELSQTFSVHALFAYGMVNKANILLKSHFSISDFSFLDVITMLFLNVDHI